MVKKSSKEMVENAKKALTEGVEATAKQVIESEDGVAQIMAAAKKEDEKVTVTTEAVEKGSEPEPDKDADDAEADKEVEDDKKKFTESAGGEGDADKDSNTMEEKVVLETPVVEVSEDLNAILSGDESLSESFKEKIALVFEAVLNSKIIEVTKSLQESANQKLEEKVKDIKESTEKSAQEFIDLVAEEWLNENELQVEQGLRVEIAEGLVQDMRSLFEMYHISLPQEKVDLLEEKTKEVDELKSKIEMLSESVSAKEKEVLELKKQEAFNVLSEGLAETQKEKFSTLVADVVAEDVESFKEKASIIKESYFSKGKEVAKEKVVTESNTSAPMSGYITAAKQLNKSW